MLVLRVPHESRRGGRKALERRNGFRTTIIKLVRGIDVDSVARARLSNGMNGECWLSLRVLTLIPNQDKLAGLRVSIDPPDALHPRAPFLSRVGQTRQLADPCDVPNVGMEAAL